MPLKKFFAFILIVVLFNPSPALYSAQAYGKYGDGSLNIKLSQYPSSFGRPIPLEVIFVNYKRSLVNLSYISDRISLNTKHLFENGEVEYFLNVSLNHASDSLERAILGFVEENKVLDNTSDLLESVLQQQLSSVQRGELGVRYKVFENNQTGYSIDAVSLERKLAELSPGIEDKFYLYVLNLSYLDDHDGGIEHWFKVDIKDADSNRTRDFWRLEWDNPLNTPVMFPFPAFNMHSRVMFIDPTAYNWYLNWTRIWWGDIPNTDEFSMYHVDLDHYLEGLNLSDPSNLKKLNDYLSRWIIDFLDDLILVATSTKLYNGVLYTGNVSIQINIVNMDPKKVPTENYYWTVNEEKIRVALDQIYPGIDVFFRINFYDIAELDDVRQVLNQNVYANSSSWTYYDGIGVYNDLFGSLSDKYFDFSGADKELVGWIFILYNASMVVMNREFTGLGGNGKIMIMMEARRILGNQLKEPRQGFSLVIIHELGHALGILHTFSSRSYASDFAFDVMGYYPGSWNFSKVRVETIHREVNDDLLLATYRELNGLLSEIYNRSDREKFSDVLRAIDEKVDQINILQNETHYKEAFNAILSLKSLVADVKKLLKEREVGDEIINIIPNLDMSKFLAYLVGFAVIVIAATSIYIIKRRKTRYSIIKSFDYDKVILRNKPH